MDPGITGSTKSKWAYAQSAALEGCFTFAQEEVSGVQQRVGGEGLNVPPAWCNAGRGNVPKWRYFGGGGVPEAPWEQEC